MENIGIDLSSTKTLLRGRQSRIITDPSGKRTIPTLFLLQTPIRKFGNYAKLLTLKDSESLCDDFSYEILSINYVMFLSYLRTLYQPNFVKNIYNNNSVSLVIPSYFSFLDRKIIKEIHQKLQIQLACLFTSPVCVAATLMLNMNFKGQVLVLDFGHKKLECGFFDINNDLNKVYSVSCDLGGEIIDRLLLESMGFPIETNNEILMKAANHTSTSSSLSAATDKYTNAVAPSQSAGGNIDPTAVNNKISTPVETTKAEKLKKFITFTIKQNLPVIKSILNTSDLIKPISIMGDTEVLKYTKDNYISLLVPYLTYLTNFLTNLKNTISNLNENKDYRIEIVGSNYLNTYIKDIVNNIFQNKEIKYSVDINEGVGCGAALLGSALSKGIVGGRRLYFQTCDVIISNNVTNNENNNITNSENNNDNNINNENNNIKAKISSNEIIIPITDLLSTINDDNNIITLNIYLESMNHTHYNYYYKQNNDNNKLIYKVNILKTEINNKHNVKLLLKLNTLNLLDIKVIEMERLDNESLKMVRREVNIVIDECHIDESLIKESLPIYEKARNEKITDDNKFINENAGYNNMIINNIIDNNINKETMTSSQESQYISIIELRNLTENLILSFPSHLSLLSLTHLESQIIDLETEFYELPFSKTLSEEEENYNKIYAKLQPLILQCETVFNTHKQNLYSLINRIDNLNLTVYSKSQYNILGLKSKINKQLQISFDINKVQCPVKLFDHNNFQKELVGLEKLYEEELFNLRQLEEKAKRELEEKAKRELEEKTKRELEESKIKDESKIKEESKIKGESKIKEESKINEENKINEESKNKEESKIKEENKNKETNNLNNNESKDVETKYKKEGKKNKETIENNNVKEKEENNTETTTNNKK